MDHTVSKDYDAHHGVTTITVEWPELGLTVTRTVQGDEAVADGYVPVLVSDAKANNPRLFVEEVAVDPFPADD